MDKRAVFGRYHSVFGEIFIAFGESGLLELSMGKGKEGFIERYKNLCPPPKDDYRFKRLFGLLDRYFRGERVVFDIPIEPKGSDFEKKVWKTLMTIPYGETRTYGWVSMMVFGRDFPKNGARAVGRACGKNPLPIIVPCHRVICSNNALGGYSLGVDVKKALLGLEGVR